MTENGSFRSAPKNPLPVPLRGRFARRFDSFRCFLWVRRNRQPGQPAARSYACTCRVAFLPLPRLSSNRRRPRTATVTITLSLSVAGCCRSSRRVLFFAPSPGALPPNERTNERAATGRRRPFSQLTRRQQQKIHSSTKKKTYHDALILKYNNKRNEERITCTVPRGLLASLAASLLARPSLVSRSSPLTFFSSAAVRGKLELKV